MERASSPEAVTPVSQRDIPLNERLYAQKHTSAKQEDTGKGLAGGLKGSWERFLDLFTFGGKPDSDFASVREWFGERGQILRFNVTGLFTRSKFQDKNARPLEGGNISGVFAPAFRLSEDTAIAVIYSGSYNRELQIFSEDEGPRQQQEEQRHELIVLLSQDYLNPFGIAYIDRLTISPSFFQSYVFTRQTQNEDWGNGVPWRGVNKFPGLYDYWDRGVGFEVKVVHKGEDQTSDSFSTAFQVYRRHYRNFISLARILNPASPEPKFEKDYIGYLGRAVYDRRTPNGKKLYLAYTFLQKNFTEDRADKDPILIPGVPSERRTDRTHTAEFRSTFPIALIPGLSVGLNGTFVYNMSSSGFNDTLSPLPPTGIFTSEYYDYWSFQAGPEISIARKIDLPFFMWRTMGLVTVTGTYSFDRRDYKDRKSKDKLGNVKNATEVDITHVISTRVVYQWSRNWAAFFRWRRSIARSNFEDERTFRYNYDINSFGLGIQYNY